LNDDFSSIRELALAKTRTHLDSLPLSEEKEERVLAMAEGDPDNKVRAEAIELLDKIGKDKYAPLFNRLVNDSSYYVAGAALSAYLGNENNSGRENLVNRFLEESNIQLLVPLADYMTNVEDPDRGEWFHSRLESLSGESLYYFIGYYGDYFARLSEIDHGPAIEHLTAWPKATRPITSGWRHSRRCSAL